MKDLKKANHLIEEIAKLHKEITPVTPNDMALFDKFFKKEPHTYGNSWTYVVQGKYGIGPFGLGYKYYDGKNLSSFSIYPKMEQPNKLCIYWTRPMGPQILDIIYNYSKEFLQSKALPTYVKKIFKNQYDFLINKGFKNTSEFPWHSDCPSEDDTFPEVIIDVKATIENASRSEKVRNSLKRYRSLSSKVVVSQIINDKDKQTGWKVAQDFFQQHVASLLANISTRYDFYNPIFSSDYAGHDLFLIRQNNLPCGIFDLNNIDNKYYSIYMSLMLREELHNLNEFSIMYRCYRVFQNGGLYLNMGGSETEGLHKFKNKFHTHEFNKMYWAAYY